MYTCTHSNSVPRRARAPVFPFGRASINPRAGGAPSAWRSRRRLRQQKKKTLLRCRAEADSVSSPASNFITLAEEEFNITIRTGTALHNTILTHPLFLLSNLPPATRPLPPSIPFYPSPPLPCSPRVVALPPPPPCSPSVPIPFPCSPVPLPPPIYPSATLPLSLPCRPCASPPYPQHPTSHPPLPLPPPHGRGCPRFSKTSWYVFVNSRVLMFVFLSYLSPFPARLFFRSLS